MNVEKTLEAGVNFCATSPAGWGMKRRLLIQPELRALLARFTGHHSRDPELGKSLAQSEYQELLVSGWNMARAASSFFTGRGNMSWLAAQGRYTLGKYSCAGLVAQQSEVACSLYMSKEASSDWVRPGASRLPCLTCLGAGRLRDAALLISQKWDVIYTWKRAKDEFLHMKR